MATWTSWRNPATGAAQNRTGGSVAWASPTRGGTSNNSYTTATLNGNSSHWLWCTNFGFTSADIPEGATITGVKARFERKQNNNTDDGIQVAYAKLIISSAEAGNEKSQSGAWPLADAVSSDFGGSGDLWGTSMTRADALATTTGVAIAGEDLAFLGSTGSIDAVELAFEYEVASTRRRIFAVVVG